MAKIRKLRGRWQAQVRRCGMEPHCKSSATKLEAEKWMRDLEAQIACFGATPDTEILDTIGAGQRIENYRREITFHAN